MTADVTGYHEKSTAPVLTTKQAAIIRLHSFALEPDRLHLITTQALAEILDPAPAGIVERSVEAIEGVPC